MNEASISAELPVPNHGWRVTFAGLGINLALGILYTWSVITEGVPELWNWSESDKSWPYAVACVVFSIIMVPAGRLQDRLGPRITATIGGLLVGIGMVLASRTTTSSGYILGIGIFAGSGIGFGYASATPPAVKWFPAERTGLIAGLVVSGFGLASVYVSFLVNWLDGAYGIQNTVLVLGIAFLIVVVVLAQVLKPPPPGYVPRGTAANAIGADSTGNKDFAPKEMLSTAQFYLLWFMYACGAGAGLMIIGKLSAIVKVQAGINLGFVLVAVLAVGNGLGRIVAGSISDKLGRRRTMFLCFTLQAVVIFLLSRACEGNFLANGFLLALISAMVGANYGANLSLFPSVTKDYYGLKNFGVNYGLVFTAWGAGGFMLALSSGMLYDRYQTFAYAYYGACGLLMVAAIMTFLLRAPHRTEQPAPSITR